jgi:hypothetical protein
MNNKNLTTGFNGNDFSGSEQNCLAGVYQHRVGEYFDL